MTKTHFENRLTTTYEADKNQHKLSDNSKTAILDHAKHVEDKQNSLNHLSLFQTKPALAFACTMMIALFSYQAWRPSDSAQGNLISYQGKENTELVNIIDNIAVVNINKDNSSSLISYNEHLKNQLAAYAIKFKRNKINRHTRYKRHYARLLKHNDQWQLALCNIRKNEILTELAQLTGQVQNRELDAFLDSAKSKKLVEIISNDIGTIVAIRSLSQGSSQLLEQNNITHEICSAQAKKTS